MSTTTISPNEDDTREVLRSVYLFLKSFIVFSSDHELMAVTLWVAHTYILDAIDITPRLVIKSPEKQTGKTRLLECLKLLVPSPLLTMNVSAAYIARRIGQGRPTILLDEYDAIFTDVGSEKNEVLRAIINAGYESGSTYGRVGPNMVPMDFPAYAAVALAGIGNPPDTILDRAVVINMRRKTKAESVQPFRKRTIKPTAVAICGALTAWAKLAVDSIDLENTIMPDGIGDRQLDIWEPLIAIADLAGSGWGEHARAACRVMTAAQAGEDVEEGLSRRLLRDLRTVFADDDRLPTDEVLRRLRTLDESEWSGMDYGEARLTPQKLARMLRPYGVKPQRWYVDRAQYRGYLRADLADAWERYLPKVGSMDDYLEQGADIVV
jgi:hypothetical protein